MIITRIYSIRTPKSLDPPPARASSDATGFRTVVGRKWNSNCYFNIYHPPLKSLESLPPPTHDDPGSTRSHNLPRKMQNVELNASIFQTLFNHCAHCLPRGLPVVNLTWENKRRLICNVDYENHREGTNNPWRLEKHDSEMVGTKGYVAIIENSG